MTGLPFVYAFWAGRPGAVAGRRRAPSGGPRRGRRPSTTMPRGLLPGRPGAAGRRPRYLRDNIKYDSRRARGSRPDDGSTATRPELGSIAGGTPHDLTAFYADEHHAARATRCAAGGRVSAAEALELYRTRRRAARPARRRGPRAQASGRRRHLHHRPQHQLHERLRRPVQLLRVLPRRSDPRGLRARLRRDLPEDRRDDRARRRADAAAGRATTPICRSSGTRTVPRGQGALSGVQAARASPPEVIHLSRLSQLAGAATCSIA